MNLFKYAIDLKSILKSFAGFSTSALCLVVVTSCGSEEKSSKKETFVAPSHDSFFDPFIEIIEEDFSQAEGKPVSLRYLSISFSDEVRPTALAHCAKKGAIKYIQFNSKHEDEFRQKHETNKDIYNMLLYVLRHEYGHCHYNLNHDFDLVLFPENNQTIKGSEGFFTKPDRIANIRTFVPSSIMYPVASYGIVSLYDKHKQYYDDILSTNSSSKTILDRRLTDYGPKEDGSYSYLSTYEMTWYQVKDLDGNLILETKNNGEYALAFYKSLFLSAHDHESDLLEDFKLID